MNILAIDTSSDSLSLALSASGGAVWQTEIQAGRRHSELLMGQIDRLFNSAGLEPKDLNLAACMQGPGSFTGLRIGYAVCKGLSAALGIPHTAIPTLDCIAETHSAWPGIVLPVMDAKKDCFFAALYRGKKKLTDYLDADLAAILAALETSRTGPDEPVIVTGPGAELFISRAGSKAARLQLDEFFFRGKSAELLKKVFEYGTLFDSGYDSGPLYLRKSDAELNLKR